MHIIYFTYSPCALVGPAVAASELMPVTLLLCDKISLKAAGGQEEGLFWFTITSMGAWPYGALGQSIIAAGTCVRGELFTPWLTRKQRGLTGSGGIF